MRDFSRGTTSLTGRMGGKRRKEKIPLKREDEKGGRNNREILKDLGGGHKENDLENGYRHI